MTDLHTHSTCSDGSLSPTQLIRLARKKGITALGLTDHDTLEGISEALSAANAVNLRFIPGIELSVAASKGEFHLLGLGLSRNLEAFEKSLKEVLALREKRNRAMVEKMQRGGIEVSYERICRYTRGEVVGRTHFAAFLVDQGKCQNMEEAFQRYLRTGGPFFIPKKLISLEDAVAWISTAGGKSFVAHPLSQQLPWEALEKALPQWKDLGILGMETMHPSARRTETQRLEEMARRNGMLMMAGSDFHGKNLPNRRLGRTGWGAKIPSSYDAVLEVFE